jgi:predicted TPR repeat methyltransferase
MGCGQGVCSSLVKESTKYIGIDLSKNLIKKALIQYNKPNNKFICASV